ncbi:unnamed protein product, partial [Prorocentrum cordatum]
DGGVKFRIRMRNMSTWGPSAKQLLKRPYDATIIQEARVNMSDTNDVLVEFDKAGYKGMVCPAGAESAHFTSKAGGVAVGVSKIWAPWSSRHLASNTGDLPGKRADKHKKDHNITTGVRFKGSVGMQVLLKDAHIAILGGYLY